MTPSQQAKDFARANGFAIEPNGRRYTVKRTVSPQCLTVVGEVGGYPAALNLMRKWLDDESKRQCAQFDRNVDTKLAHCDVVRDDGALGLFADTVIGDNPADATATIYGLRRIPGETDDALLARVAACARCLRALPLARVAAGAPVIKPEYQYQQIPINTRSAGISFDVNPRDVVDGRIMRGVAHRNEGAGVVESRAFDLTQPADDVPQWKTKTADEIRADIKDFLDQTHADALRYSTGDKLDAVAKRMGKPERAVALSDREYRNLLIYGDTRGWPGVDFPLPVVTTGAILDEWALLPTTSHDTVRKEAARLRRTERKASGKPPGGPWHVIFNGNTVMKYGYPSRADAIAVVRWGFNYPDATIRNNWRTAAVTTEYRSK